MNLKKFFGRKKEQDQLEAFRTAAGYRPPDPPSQPRRAVTADVTFRKTVCDVPHRLTTSEWEGAVDHWEEVEDALERMLDGELEFVILIAGDAPQGIRFVQTCLLPDKVGATVELSMEEPGSPRTRLVEKDCGEDEVFDIFRAFYRTGGVPDRERYRPVEFFA